MSPLGCLAVMREISVYIAIVCQNIGALIVPSCAVPLIHCNNLRHYATTIKFWCFVVLTFSVLIAHYVLMSTPIPGPAHPALVEI
jgi:hypothetical protein